MSRPAVFLDRDGTLNVEREGALSDPRRLELIPGAAEAVARLGAEGFAVVVVTNQSAVARGWMTLAQLAAVHEELVRLLAASGGHVDAVYFCPHYPPEERPRPAAASSSGAANHELRRVCDCRKPAPGMFLRAIAELDLDPARSFAIGDARRDLEAAGAAGVRPLLVATGKGAAQYAALVEARESAPPFFTDVAAAVDHILTTCRDARSSGPSK